MPTYQYECKECQHHFTEIVKIADRENNQECPSCGAVSSQLLISAVGLNFPGDGWATKNGRIARQMRERRRGLTEKTREQIREQPGMTLAPNVNGERVESWKDAKKLAKDKGLNTSSYNPMVKKEASRT